MSNSGKTSNKRTLVGFVVSDKNDKTIVVRVESSDRRIPPFERAEELASDENH